jgi:2-polyprenyl-6-methoxyphenol hydroxylase-like FAD-dependent oxidoreductase
VRVFRSATNDRFISLPRGDLAERIRATVAGELETLFADGVQTLHQDDHGVDVTFEASGTRRFDLVIGADGLHSAVRAAALGEEHRFEKHLGYSVAAFNAAGYPHRDENAYVSYTIPGHQVARYSLRDGTTGFVFVFVDDAVAGTDHHCDDAGHKAILRRAYGDAGWECPAILDAMDGCDDLYFDRVSQIRMERWSHRRVALVGDAGFCPSLLAGEGAGLAMAGAYILAGELRAANGDHEMAFEKYQACFKPFVDRKQAAATRFGGWFAPRSRFGIRVRDMTTRLFTIPLVGDWMAQRFIADRLNLPDYPE